MYWYICDETKKKCTINYASSFSVIGFLFMYRRNLQPAALLKVKLIATIYKAKTPF